MRNLTWQTDFRSSVPYKKGDDLEYSWIFSGDSPRNIAMDISLLRNFLDITRMELDDKEVSEKDLSHMYIRDSSLLKITGKAKNTSSTETVLQPKIVVEIQEREKEEVQKEEVPIPQTEPTGITIDQTRYNSNINNLLTLRGQNLSAIEFVNI